MAKYNKRFKKNTKYPHKRSEGLTRRGLARQERLMLGRMKPCPCPSSLDPNTGNDDYIANHGRAVVD